jgi:hypothetical protein
MELLLTSEEGKFLIEVLEERHRELLREISRTKHHGFKATLKNNERLLESILNKVRSAEPVAC